jgi:hypothetical protein
MSWLVALVLAVAVAWPGTPPGAFVRDAAGGISDADLSALCAPVARHVLPALPPAPAPTLPPPGAVAAPAPRAAAHPAAPALSAPPGARAPPAAS